MKPILEVKNMTMDFGGLRAIDNLDLFIDKGEIVALIGPNGAGKTTFFNCITGIYTPTSGDVFIDPDGDGKKERINNLKPNLVTRRGLARTFQNIRLFSSMTVLENVMIGCHAVTKAGILGAIFRGPSTKAEENLIVEKSYNILEKIGLAKYVNELAVNLPYGAQRRLEIARAMATEPFLLLLDEPAAGMNPQETLELDALIMKLRDNEGISILLIEHDMKLVMSLSERIYVVDYGKKIGEGTPEDIRSNPVVIKAYLGEEIEEDA
ncbi:leucine/isoleucine/valine transporter subunit; ATP-binding component of ABC superfamily [Desulfamplus magnetovallimortis]|uniref:Leucine/isoleucine/valine transporter subunit ATP-binding component of ABC superfamily n=1 Tax=Desulfamplus magnetovallimortis TaxID=1246637 RepID=A0A1W1H4Y0_9BACT|nr:ABC transporter ATP-binding protein [Desulfamplus magnetovallimortis]SLM27504.1 leucine/isoleucine/valine transporter subunit; ATP-binding component of ABC superfamily [Desulfamplus magnetovallimortis]